LTWSTCFKQRCHSVLSTYGIWILLKVRTVVIIIILLFCTKYFRNSRIINWHFLTVVICYLWNKRLHVAFVERRCFVIYLFEFIQFVSHIEIFCFTCLSMSVPTILWYSRTLFISWLISLFSRLVCLTLYWYSKRK